jgi:RNA polymerase sigma-70 factor (ECF subfamily)
MVESEMDELSIESLYERYGSIVYRRAKQLLGDEHAAKDAVQEVFARAIRAKPEFTEHSPVTWLYRVTTNHCLNVRRNQTKRHHLLVVKGRTDAEHRDQVNDRLTVMSLIESMPQELAQIALYYYFDELNQEEIAELLGVSRRTVGNRLEEFRARALEVL